MTGLKMLFAILIVSMIFGCAKHTVLTEYDLEKNCFGAVEKKDWVKARQSCTELIMVNDNHYGGWGQLCLAEYHLDHINTAFECCAYALSLGSRDDRVIHAFTEIEFVVVDRLKQEKLKAKKK